MRATVLGLLVDRSTDRDRYVSRVHAVAAHGPGRGFMCMGGHRTTPNEQVAENRQYIVIGGDALGSRARHVAMLDSPLNCGSA